MGFLAKLCTRAILALSLLLGLTTWSQAASLRITWEDTSTNEEGFKIERVVAGLVEATMTVGPNTSSYTDYGLTNGSVYCYRVMAFNSAGASPSSNQPCLAAQDTTLVAATIGVSPASVAVAGTVTTSWSGIAASTPTDWIGIYAAGSSDTSFVDWFYLNCSKTAGDAKASGSCSYTLPDTMTAGSYELRLFANDGFTRLGMSAALAVVNEPVEPSLIVSPAVTAPGRTVTASWSEIDAPSTTDWLGLYAPGTVDADFLSWIYVSCSQIPGAARASGTCSYVLPQSLVSGNYELRLYANDGYTRIATATLAIKAAPAAPSKFSVVSVSVVK
jgi:hypothetical protein